MEEKLKGWIYNNLITVMLMYHIRVRFDLPASHDTEKERLANGYYIPFNYHPDIDEKYIEKVFHIKDDGWCGFRVMAALVMNSQDLYALVKKKMLKKLKDNEAFYQEHVCLTSKEEFYNLKERMEYQRFDHPCPLKYWFEGSTDFQLAADTFGVPIAIYTVNSSENIPPALYLPLLTPKYKTLPLVLHHIYGNHFIGIQMKKNIKIMLPKINYFTVSAMKSLGNYGVNMAFWRHLNLQKESKAKEIFIELE